MVSFNCDGCGDVVKKPKLDSHSQRCHASFTCLDCSRTFQNANAWRSHTSCITEAEKYEKSMWKGGLANGKNDKHLRADDGSPILAPAALTKPPLDAHIPPNVSAEPIPKRRKVNGQANGAETFPNQNGRIDTPPTANFSIGMEARKAVKKKEKKRQHETAAEVEAIPAISAPLVSTPTSVSDVVHSILSASKKSLSMGEVVERVVGQGGHSQETAETALAAAVRLSLKGGKIKAKVALP
jgi:hypothetical protein